MYKRQGTGWIGKDADHIVNAFIQFPVETPEVRVLWPTPSTKPTVMTSAATLPDTATGRLNAVRDLLAKARASLASASWATHGGYDEACLLYTSQRGIPARMVARKIAAAGIAGLKLVG